MPKSKENEKTKKPQRKPEEKMTVDQLLKLVHQLTREEQNQLLDQLKFEDLHREIHKGIEASERGEVVSLQDLNRRLDAKHAEILERRATSL